MNPKIRVQISLVFFMLLLTTIGALGEFRLPAAESAKLEHFLLMSPMGIYNNLIAVQASPLREVYYLPTTRVGFVGEPFELLAFLLLVGIGASLVWRWRGEG